ncbi:hypothetical protein F2Q70_00010245 [Brassica cretica]|uniref:Uncharacterized protein n=1 Tax=Brassica cretica TaxID=69181 RepID=A0A8S9M0J4_BRACR|nr:hypothetical protein F2Q70_00010245 [Brassica cretica]
MEGLESVYAQAIYGMTRETKIMEHQGSDLIWGGNDLSRCFMSDIGIIGETQHHQHVGNRASSIDPSSIDCLLSATTNSNNTPTEDDEGISVHFSDCHALWSFGGVSSAESENREITTETTTTKPKSSKRNRGNRDETGSYFCLVGHPQEESEKGNFKLIYDENQSKSKKPRTEKDRVGSSNISFQQHSASLSDNVEPDAEVIAQMKEMIYTAAAFRPVNLGLEVVEKPKRKNVRISTDPQTVAARQRRERSPSSSILSQSSAKHEARRSLQSNPCSLFQSFDKSNAGAYSPSPILVLPSLNVRQTLFEYDFMSP